MPQNARSSTRWFTLAADTIALLSLALAACIGWSDGVRWHLGPVVLAARSGTRALIFAAIVLAARHALVPRPSIVARLFAALRWIARPRRPTSVSFDWPSAREWLGATLVMVAATAVMLRQQLLAFTRVPDLGDPLFSMWRLGWVAHQLAHDPWHLFDGNIYHPALRTLAYSDAMLVPGFVAAPAIWIGVPVVVVYNGLLLITFVASGVAMFALARAVTRDTGAATIAGLVFAFDPFRLSHYSHLELQFTCWMPLALLALLRTLTTGRVGGGVALGIFVSLQALSSLYYGAYLSVSLLVVALGWIWSTGWPDSPSDRRAALRTVGSLAVAALIVGGMAAWATSPYRANRSIVGERSVEEIHAFSASARHYLTSSRRSAVYGASLYQRQGDELELFTGTAPIVLAAASLVPPAGPVVVPAVLALLASVDGSLGLHGTIYTWLNQLPPFRGFRVPARFRAVAGLYLALLAGMGTCRILRVARWPSVRWLIVGTLAVAVLIDLHPSLELEPLWTRAPDIYARVPEGAVLADLPGLGEDDSRYVYFATFHWRPIVNGASGFQPAWYTPLAAAGRGFPADDSLDAFKRLGTEYFVLHGAFYRNDFPQAVAAAEAQPRLQLVATSAWEHDTCRLYRLLK